MAVSAFGFVRNMVRIRDRDSRANGPNGPRWVRGVAGGQGVLLLCAKEEDGYQCGQSKWKGSTKLTEPSASTQLSSAEEADGPWTSAGSSGRGLQTLGAMGDGGA